MNSNLMKEILFLVRIDLTVLQTRWKIFQNEFILSFILLEISNSDIILL